MWQKAYGVLSDAHEAEDACQEAFIRIMKVIDRIEDADTLRTKAFCCMIARNVAIDMARRNGRMQPAEDEILEQAGSQQETETPERIVASNEGVRQLAERIAELPEGYREVLRLRCLYEMSAEQTGELLGITPNTVNIRLTRARKMLRERLKETESREA